MLQGAFAITAPPGRRRYDTMVTSRKSYILILNCNGFVLMPPPAGCGCYLRAASCAGGQAGIGRLAVNPFFIKPDSLTYCSLSTSGYKVLCLFKKQLN